ncbi:ricin-type beta-trefoil lectin domain protein [Streptomyces sp. SDT5-1]|uniref:ricin-type beta-trefoil lectin domain protein n=1 Tax=Streptomyces sp. SDT5-1 TaxID=3406418 RepID=UPI003FD26EFB
MSANGGARTSAPDHRLVALLRADTSTAYGALGELRRRHRHALFGYARLCTADPDAGRQLGAQAFARAAREVARGLEPGSWRHHTLLHAHRLAAEWAADERRTRLAPGLLAALYAPDAGRPPALLDAFHLLSPRAQTLLWHSVVDEEPDAATGLVVGAPAREVAQARGEALEALRGTVLAAREARAQGAPCLGLRRLVEPATRPARPRRTADLDAHLARCPSCTAAYLELTALRDTPRSALAEGLLPWGAADHLTAEPAPTPPPPPAPRRRPRNTVPPRHRAAPGARPRRRRAAPMRLALASTAAGVALVPLLILTLTEGRPDLSAVVQGTATTPEPSPPATVTATTTTTATATATATATETVTVSPSPPAPSTSAGKPTYEPSPTAPHRPGDDRTTAPPSPSVPLPSLSAGPDQGKETGPQATRSPRRHTSATSGTPGR